MFFNFSKIALFAFLFGQLAIASEVSWPTHFEGRHFEPSPSKIYGCLGNYDEYTLTLDLVNNVYTKIELICNSGNVDILGERGRLRVEKDQLIMTVTEYTDVSGSETRNPPLEWFQAFEEDTGYFNFNPETQRFDEYDPYGILRIRW